MGRYIHLWVSFSSSVQWGGWRLPEAIHIYIYIYIYMDSKCIAGPDSVYTVHSSTFPGAYILEGCEYTP